jgi:membrane protease YdiL (CAAX protease family)
MRSRWSRFAALLVGAGVFGALMELRGHVDGAVLRALVASAAGAVLGVTILYARGRE